MGERKKYNNKKIDLEIKTSKTKNKGRKTNFKSNKNRERNKTTREFN